MSKNIKPKSKHLGCEFTCRIFQTDIRLETSSQSLLMKGYPDDKMIVASFLCKNEEDATSQQKIESLKRIKREFNHQFDEFINQYIEHTS